MATSPQVDPDMKAMMKASGHWTPFVSYRRELKDNEGMAPKDARKMALDRYLTLSKEYHDKQGVLSDKDSNGNTPAAKGVSFEGGAGSSPSSFNSDSHTDIPQEVMNKNANIVEVVEFVAKHLETGATEEVIAKAPSASAVSMLKSFSRDTNRKNKFWDDIFTKLIPSKTNLDQGKREGYDGEFIHELVHSIVKEMKGFKDDEDSDSRVSAVPDGREEPGVPQGEQSRSTVTV